MKVPTGESFAPLRERPSSGVEREGSTGVDWQLWLVVMAGALGVRLIFYTGFFGSDEVTYTAAAFKLLQGDWAVSNYVGSNRYGVNLPMAGFASLFGPNEFAAALFSMLCSLAEVALVFSVGQRMLGRRAGFLAAAVLALMPLHVHSAGRLMADAPLALAMTASFLMFWNGQTRNRSSAFACAGVAAGLAFWIKPHAVLYLLLFLSYPLLFWRWNWKWAWMLAGFVVLLLANGALFWALTGNPLFLIDAIRARQSSGYLESGAASGSIEDGPLFYLRYLFAKVYHTGLVAYLALGAVLLWLARRDRREALKGNAIAYCVWWSFGLVLLFSLFVVSWRPLLFIPKQTNYMLMFLAPLSLLAGHTLARFRGLRGWAVAAAVLLPSILLAGMQQNSIRVFTANSKAALEFSRAHLDSEVFVNTNALRAATFNNLVRPDAAIGNVRFIGDLTIAPPDLDIARSSGTRYAIIDTETLSWGSDEPIKALAEVPSCWTKVGLLQPTGLGAGTRMLVALHPVASLLPERLRDSVTGKLDTLTQPAPAYVFKLPPTGCGLAQAR